MRHLALLAACIIIFAYAYCGKVWGAERAKRPTVCMSYAIAKTDKASDDAIALCYDNAKPGKRPTTLYLFREVEIPGADGSGPVKALVGWR